jgi:hypothetical protein
VGFVISGFVDNPVVPLLCTLGVFVLAVFVLSRLFGEKKYNIDTLASEAQAEE